MLQKTQAVCNKSIWENDSATHLWNFEYYVILLFVLFYKKSKKAHFVFLLCYWMLMQRDAWFFRLKQTDCNLMIMLLCIYVKCASYGYKMVVQIYKDTDVYIYAKYR